MIELTPITHPDQLEEYHRFRFRIYRKTPAFKFLTGQTYVDRDSYDQEAIHLGWHEDGELKGCIRFIKPLAGKEDSLYALSRLPKSERFMVKQFIDHHLKAQLPVIEISRICIEESVVSRWVLRQFSLAIIQKLLDFQLDHAVFTVFWKHRKVWETYGCTVLPGTDSWKCPVTGITSFCMNYQKDNIPEGIWDELSEQTKENSAA